MGCMPQGESVTMLTYSLVHAAAVQWALRAPCSYLNAVHLALGEGHHQGRKVVAALHCLHRRHALHDAREHVADVQPLLPRLSRWCWALCGERSRLLLLWPLGQTTTPAEGGKSACVHQLAMEDDCGPEGTRDPSMGVNCMECNRKQDSMNGSFLQDRMSPALHAQSHAHRCPRALPLGAPSGNRRWAQSASSSGFQSRISSSRSPDVQQPQQQPQQEVHASNGFPPAFWPLAWSCVQAQRRWAPCAAPALRVAYHGFDLMFVAIVCPAV